MKDSTSALDYWREVGRVLKAMFWGTGRAWPTDDPQIALPVVGADILEMVLPDVRRVADSAEAIANSGGWGDIDELHALIISGLAAQYPHLPLADITSVGHAFTFWYR